MGRYLGVVFGILDIIDRILSMCLITGCSKHDVIAFGYSFRVIHLVLVVEA